MGDKNESQERTPLLQEANTEPTLEESPRSGSITVPPSDRVRKQPVYGSSANIPQSWSNYFSPTHYTESNKPNRRPFHIPHSGSSTNFLVGEGGSRSSLGDRKVSTTSPPNQSRLSTTSQPPHADLHHRYRYYSRLRANALPGDDVLTIPDHVVPTDFLVLPGGKDAQGKQSSVVTVISIWNTMMGTSLLTMPWAFGEAGVVAGVTIMLGMAAVALFTAYSILTLQKAAGIKGPLLEASRLCREIVQGTLGRILEGGAVVFSVITLLGAMVVYWVLMTNFLYNTGQLIYDSSNPPVNQSHHQNHHYHNLTGHKHIDLLCASNITFIPGVPYTPDPTTPSPPTYIVANGVLGKFVTSNGTVDETSTFEKFWSQDLTVPLYLLILFVPLLSIKNTKIFSYFNSMGAISVLAIYVFVIYKASTWGMNYNFTDVTSEFYAPLFRDKFMALSGTLSLAYFIHNCIVTIMKSNRNPENNVRDLSLAFVMVMGTYIPIGMLFFLSFPLPKSCIADNFLDNFPPHTVVLAVVRCFLLFQMITVFPLLSVFLRTQLLTFLRGGDTSAPPTYVTALVNACVLCCCVLVAIFYPNVGFLIRWIGAVAGLVYVFLLPCVLHIKVRVDNGTCTATTVLIYGTIIVLGVMNFVSQFFL